MSGWRPGNSRLEIVVAGIALWLAACATVDSSRSKEIFYLHLPAPDGSLVDLSRFKGKVLMLDFFTTWSQASVVAIPGYSALYDRYHQEGLAVCAIALDEMGAKVVQPFVDGMRIPYPVLLADDRVKSGSSPLGDFSINPVLIIFDRSGKIRKVFVGLVPLRQIEKLVKELL